MGLFDDAFGQGALLGSQSGLLNQQIAASQNQLNQQQSGLRNAQTQADYDMQMAQFNAWEEMEKIRLQPCKHDMVARVDSSDPAFCLKCKKTTAQLVSAELKHD